MPSRSTVRHTSRARVVEVIGNPTDQRQISLIAVHAHGIPEDFSKAALDEAAAIRNTQIAEELALPPVKIHCSILAEDAIKAAVADYRTKHGSAQSTPQGVAAAHEQAAAD